MKHADNENYTSRLGVNLQFHVSKLRIYLVRSINWSNFAQNEKEMIYRYSLIAFLGAISLLLISAGFSSTSTEVESYNPAPPFSGGAGTGGLGDRTGSPVSSSTCTQCHSGGSFGAAITVIITEGLTPVTTYVPGNTYNMYYSISGNASGFGFQSGALTTTNAAGGTFISPSANAQLVTIAGRPYIEHDNGASTSNVFQAMWTAPAAGAGDINFYAIGLAVNGNGGTSGDQVTLPVSITLTEAVSSTIAYSGTSYCANESNQTPVIVGEMTGTFSSTAGLSINASSGVIDIASSTPGTYTISYTYSTGVATATVTINEIFTSSFVADICDNETFTFGSQTLTASDAGLNTEVFQAVNGCDSTVTLTLTVNPSYVESQAATICDNETYDFSGQILTAADAGLNTQVFQSVDGCDSTVNLTLTVNPTYTESDAVTICDNETYDFNGQILTSADAGLNTTVFQSINGCDSTVNLTLTVNPTYTVSDALAICDNETYDFNGQILTSADAGLNTTVFQSVNGCDSTVNLTLSVNPIYTESDAVTICDNETYDFNGQILTSADAGLNTTVFQADNGCDSTVNLTLTVLPSYSETTTVAICDNETYDFNGQILTSADAGLNTEIFQSGNGCDSIVNLTLVVNPTYTVSDAVTICDGDTYDFNGQILTSADAGLNTTVFQSINGCDSTVNLTLTVGPTYTVSDAVTICDNETYDFNGQILTSADAGLNTTVYQSVNGCDSTVNLTLSVNPIYTESDAVTICDNETYDFNGQILTSADAGLNTTVFQSVSGCDSTVNLTLTVLPSYSETTTVAICDNETYDFNGQILTSADAGLNTEVFQSANGCDSTVNLTLVVNPTYTVSDAVTICDNETYNFNGQILTSADAGLNTTVFQSVSGCDSTVNLTLSVNPTFTESDAVTICDNETYDFNGQILTSADAGLNTTVYQSVNGCDSTVNLTLSVNPTYTESDAVTICDNETYDFNGQILTSADAGLNTTVYQSVSGCDSTVNLTLTVNPTYSESDAVTICDNETYDFNGQILTSADAGLNTTVFQSVNGCDSTVNLTLTVNPTFTDNMTATICEGETYDFDGQILTDADEGLNTIVYQSVNGCDSTVNLTLIVDFIDNGVSQFGGVVTANQTGATYQWLDCGNGNAPISGATDVSYSPSLTGIYAVEITLNNCADTSACTNVITNSIDELNFNSIVVFPNPVTDVFEIKNSEGLGSIHSIYLMDAKGGLVDQISLENASINIGHLESGVYFLRIVGEFGVSITSVVKE